MNFFKRAQSSSEIAAKEDYNRDTVALKKHNNDNNARDVKKNKKGLGDFFKKFFD